MHKDLPDQALIAAAQQGSAPAWDALVRRHETRVYNFCLRFTDTPDDALDLLQEVFLGIYRNLSKFRGDALFTTWLFRIAHNKAIDMARRRNVGPPIDNADDYSVLSQAEDFRAGADEEISAQQRNRQLHKLLLQLPTDQRMTIELKFFQELTFEEIADIEGISPNTAKTRYYAALKKLHELMEPRL
jgi:RNA polymerase sigma-70 factor (ECF subfamily)